MSNSCVLRTLVRWPLTFVYLIIIVQALRTASPVFIDGGGPSASFAWGMMPSPDLREYYGHRRYYDSIYLLPYLGAAALAWAVGCMAVPFVVEHSRLLRAHRFIGTTAISLFVLMLIAACSDIGSILGLWSAPLFFLHGNLGLPECITLAKVFLPASLLAGVVALVRQAHPHLERSPK